jgi:2-polyprenyl-3-methyl-5-hydroxy-6-metoxy-1,4-benzoquinol methylase
MGHAVEPGQEHIDSSAAPALPVSNNEGDDKVGLVEALGMQEEQKEKQDASVRADRSPALQAQRGMADQTGVPAETILAYLANNPDLGGLREAFPQLTTDDLRACFARAQALVHETPTAVVKTQRVRKGATQTVVARTHGLPPPDTSINKVNIFKTLLAPLKPGRMLDLGAGKGNFSLVAAQLGWAVTAVDARTVRWPDLEAESNPELAALIRAIRWVQADVREFPIGQGEYDLICILGLLHHLEVADQVALLKRCSATLTILDTRIAKTIVDREESYEGMLIREHGQTREERDAVPQASWGNPLSFQHTEESSLRLVLDCGYIKMLQMRPPHRRDYTFYLCLPAAANLRRGERQSPREERQARETA